MQLDFHFYTIYTLCMLSGIKHEYSKKISYASQHTDDAKYNHELEFVSGGRFQQQMSAHKFIDPRVFDNKTCYDIFLPFHFLSGVEGQEFYEMLLCRENSVTANELLNDTLRTLDKPYGLQRLGVTLHVYADTWSHQDFHGLNRDGNKIDYLDLLNTEKTFINEVVLGTSKLIPPLGHGQVYTYPDEPYLRWEYSKCNAEEHYKINNLDRFIDAAFHIFSFLANQVKEHTPVIFEKEPAKWNEIEDKFIEIFSIRESLEQREIIWQRRISEGFFGFKSNIEYNDREWFYEAVEVKNKDLHIYDKKEKFQISDWKYFHDALTLHKFYVKNELLPKYGIIT
ncbi:hypothetical protein J2Z76_000173 [Sedimentibacter acidaminivorans]|uniref:Uncharacterized protein n=1 Tax=Sedimentibacter acidaminivorans TaxID=913099 RepID=A0ABS4G9F1_9FIRM|nr:DUF6765 family protein [Sedimentibacter acidaminivorans]MBP1924320.1 hypothetical protein [Sedimentibacter acidaminivorans]